MKRTALLILGFALAGCVPPEQARLQDACQSGNLGACSALANIRAHAMDNLVDLIAIQEANRRASIQPALTCYQLGSFLNCD